jgi:hypothetical protein
MADNHVMFNRKKVKSKTPVRDLMKEYFRDEKTADKYDNGVRNIDTSKTKDNVAIIKPPENFDRIRKERINQLSEERKKKGQRAMRSDTVDLIETVIQADSEMLKKMTREEQIKFYKSCIEVMQEDEKTYGKIDAAVIHFDETTTHAQVLSSTLDFENHKSRAKEMFGNRVKMSVDQTEFVHAIQKKGYTGVTRGKNRVEVNYRERKKEQEEKFKVNINRHNEHIIDEIEKDKQSIKGIKKDVVDGLVRDYPKMSIVRNKKTHELSEPFESKEMQEELHSYSLENVLLLKNQLDEHTRKQREKKLKEREEKLKQQEEEQKKKDDELNSREQEQKLEEEDLNAREEYISAIYDKAIEFNHFYNTVRPILFYDSSSDEWKKDRMIIAQLKEDDKYDEYLEKVDDKFKKADEVAKVKVNPNPNPKPKPEPKVTTIKKNGKEIKVDENGKPIIDLMDD